MSIGWIQPTIGLVFVIILLLSAQIVVGEHGSRSGESPQSASPRRSRAKRPTIQPHFD
ncbi:MAG: hypothetical protein KJ000_06395 [Pirellulaceae bacterium]|nr:hypothetical protein [Pirellulaceae bacterium]